MTEAVAVNDVWDSHWDERTNELMRQGFGKRLNRFLNKMRGRALIIHRPTGCDVMTTPVDIIEPYSHIDFPPHFFAGAEMEPALDPLPATWTRQHPDIGIAREDYISTNPSESYSLIASKGIMIVYLVGLHLDVCLMNNRFGAQKLRELGFTPIIVEDLTETLILDKAEALSIIKDKGYKVMKSKEIL